MKRWAWRSFSAGVAVGLWVGATIVIEFAGGFSDLVDISETVRREYGRPR